MRELGGLYRAPTGANRNSERVEMREKYDAMNQHYTTGRCPGCPSPPENRILTTYWPTDGTDKLGKDPAMQQLDVPYLEFKRLNTGRRFVRVCDSKSHSIQVDSNQA